MIIQCPSCGFSGRVPGYAANAPHHARCPKCQFRFSIGDRSPPIVDHRRDLSRSRMDPGSSSYEIKAMTDDFADDDDDERDEREWSEDWDGAIEADDDDPPTARPVELPPFLRKRNDPPPRARESWFNRANIDLTTWHARLYQTWAVVFLVWAAIISLRGLIATISRDDAFLFSTSVLWPVASVVLLVSASAGLFFLIDFDRGRRLATTTGATGTGVVNAPISRPEQGTAESTTVKPRKLTAG